MVGHIQLLQLGFLFSVELLLVEASLLLGLGETGHDLIVDVLFSLQVLFQDLLCQVTQLQLSHEFVHCVPVQKFSIANLADLPSLLADSLVFVLFCRVDSLLVCLHGERSGLVDVFRAVEVSAEVAKTCFNVILK